jgi:hypothetical protein
MLPETERRRRSTPPIIPIEFFSSTDASASSMCRYPSTRVNRTQNEDEEPARQVDIESPLQGLLFARGSPMKKPTIRVTKWLGDIPVEAACSACASAIFRAKGSGHRPNREEFQKSIQAQFDEHCKRHTRKNDGRPFQT